MMRKYPGLYLLLFVVSGIALADLVRLPAWFALLASLLFSILGILWLTNSDRRRRALAFGLAFLFFSAFHFGQLMYDTGPYHIAGILKEKGSYHIFGVVDDWPVLKTNRTEIMVSLDSAGVNRLQRVSGRILLKISDTTTALQRGDRLEFRGAIYPLKSRESAGGFDYSRFLNLKGVFGIVYLPTLLDVRVDHSSRFGLYRTVDRIRTWIRSSLEKNLTPTAAALSSGFLIGETREIPPDIYRLFRDSGTMHLLAVSGSNVALLILFFVVLMRPFQFRPGQRYVILLGAVFLFTLLSYGEPSVVRASIMATLVIVAKLFQRRYDLNNVIALTAFIILLVDPTHLFNVGFQLSFATAWGLILVVPKIDQRFYKRHNRIWYRWLVLPAIVALTAQVFSLPLVAFYFYRVPVLSVFANLAIVPMTSLAVFGVLAALIFELILPLFGLLVGSWLSWYLSCLVSVLRFFGGELAPVLSMGRMPVPVLLLIYFFLLLTVWSFRSKRVARVSVILFFIVFNLELARNVTASMSSPDSDPVICSSVPGGAVAIIPTMDGHRADLVVLGMKGAVYPIDDRILDPLLQRSGIERLENIFVLSVQFDAVDDLLRLVPKYRVDRIYHAKAQSAIFRDALAKDPSSEYAVSLMQYPENISSLSAPGIYPFEDNLLLLGKNSRIWFSTDLSDKLAAVVETYRPGTLIAGLAVDLLPADLEKLAGAGFNKIVCSNNKQASSVDHTDHAESTITEIIYLSRRGRVTVDFEPGTLLKSEASDLH